MVFIPSENGEPPSIHFFENKVPCVIDFKTQIGIPEERLYIDPRPIPGGHLRLFGDGFGILGGELLGVQGEYGVGKIAVILEDLPIELQRKIQKTRS